jgi:hypothetical protein
MPEPGTPTAMLVAMIDEMIRNGIDPADVAARVLAAIRANELYVFTHPEMRAEVEGRFAAITAAFDKTARLIFRNRPDVSSVATSIDSLLRAEHGGQKGVRPCVSSFLQ